MNSINFPTSAQKFIPVKANLCLHCLGQTHLIRSDWSVWLCWFIVGCQLSQDEHGGRTGHSWQEHSLQGGRLHRSVRAARGQAGDWLVPSWFLKSIGALRVSPRIQTISHPVVLVCLWRKILTPIGVEKEACWARNISFSIKIPFPFFVFSKKRLWLSDRTHVLKLFFFVIRYTLSLYLSSKKNFMSKMSQAAECSDLHVCSHDFILCCMWTTS